MLLGVEAIERVVRIFDASLKASPGCASTGSRRRRRGSGREHYGHGLYSSKTRVTIRTRSDMHGNNDETTLFLNLLKLIDGVTVCLATHGQGRLDLRRDYSTNGQT